jgi:hypothetical protein
MAQPAPARTFSARELARIFDVAVCQIRAWCDSNTVRASRDGKFTIGAAVEAGIISQLRNSRISAKAIRRALAIYRCDTRERGLRPVFLTVSGITLRSSDVFVTLTDRLDPSRNGLLLAVIDIGLLLQRLRAEGAAV